MTETINNLPKQLRTKNRIYTTKRERQQLNVCGGREVHDRRSRSLRCKTQPAAESEVRDRRRRSLHRSDSSKMNREKGCFRDETPTPQAQKNHFLVNVAAVDRTPEWGIHTTTVSCHLKMAYYGEFYLPQGAVDRLGIDVGDDVRVKITHLTEE